LSHFPRQKKQNPGKIDVKPHHHHKRFTALFRDHPGEPVPEQNFCTLWCKERLTEIDMPTIQLGATSSGLTSAHLHFPHIFLRAGCPSCCPTNSIKPKYNPAVKSTICLSQWLSGTYTVRAVSDGYQHQSDFSPQCGYISREL